jgi:hypothetical protein
MGVRRGNEPLPRPTIMRGDRWGLQGPPSEAYSRVTNPERFAPLHEIATALLKRLELDFDVERAEGFGLDPQLEHKIGVARPTIILTPRIANAAGAPVSVSFSTFPGLHVRFGHWYTCAFPACGCDACDETLDEEVERFAWLTQNVTEGRFREEISIQDSGQASKRAKLWSADGRSEENGSFLGPDEAQQLLTASRQSTYDWISWPRRAEEKSDPWSVP